MGEAFAWIGQVFEWLGRFIPRKIVLDTTEAAIKFKHGNEVVYCPPGVHWYWPWTTNWSVYPIVNQTDRLETQTMETVDGRTFIVSGTLTYSIDDLRLLVPCVHNAATAVIDIAMTAVHDVCCDMTWETLQLEQRKGTLKTKLRNEAQRQLVEYGVRVIRLKLNTLARGRVLKVSQSVSQEEN